MNDSEDLMLWIIMLYRKARFGLLPEAYCRQTFAVQNVFGSEEQIGSSSSEAVEFLYRSGFLSKRQYHVLMRSIRWSLRTRKTKPFLSGFRCYCITDSVENPETFQCRDSGRERFVTIPSWTAGIKIKDEQADFY